MGLFFEWMSQRFYTEGMPAGWQPSPQIAHDPFVSALEKIQRNLGRLPFNANFASSENFMTQFGLSPQELERLLRARVLQQGPDGWNVNQQSFSNWFKQLRGSAPSLNTPGSPYGSTPLRPPVTPPPPPRTPSPPEEAA